MSKSGSEHQVQHTQHNDQENYSHHAARPEEVGHPVTAGAHNERVNLVSGDQKRVRRGKCDGECIHGRIRPNPDGHIDLKEVSD